MQSQVLTTIAVTGFTVAFLHAAIPTHWLPFVLTGRVQKWSRSKTLMVTALAGSGHVLITALLGFLIAWCGIALNDKLGRWFPVIAGGALLAFGFYYVVQQLRGKGHGHEHGHHHDDHDHGDPHELEPAPMEPLAKRSDAAAILSLLALLTFSPCEGFLPVYVSGVSFGWGGFLVLTLILSFATLAGMVFFTWLTLAGLDRLKLTFLEKYESGILGGLLCLLGILVILLEK